LSHAMDGMPGFHLYFTTLSFLSKEWNDSIHRHPPKYVSFLASSRFYCSTCRHASLSQKWRLSCRYFFVTRTPHWRSTDSTGQSIPLTLTIAGKEFVRCEGISSFLSNVSLICFGVPFHIDVSAYPVIFSHLEMPISYLTILVIDTLLSWKYSTLSLATKEILFPFIVFQCIRSVSMPLSDFNFPVHCFMLLLTDLSSFQSRCWKLYQIPLSFWKAEGSEMKNKISISLDYKSFLLYHFSKRLFTRRGWEKSYCAEESGKCL
jgi:hypothetical protein